MPSEVQHPDHYNQYKGFEVIDVCEQLGFNKGNAFKYIARAGWKPVGDVGKEIQDLEKARFYLLREIDRLNAERASQEDVESVYQEPSTKLRDDKKYSYSIAKAGRVVQAIQFTGVNLMEVLLFLGHDHRELLGWSSDYKAEDGEEVNVWAGDLGNTKLRFKTGQWVVNYEDVFWTLTNEQALESMTPLLGEDGMKPLVDLEALRKASKVPEEKMKG